MEEAMSMAVSYDQVDPTFRDVWETLLGDAVDVREAYALSKFAPASSDVHVNGPRNEKDKAKERKIANAGLAGSALAGVAGSHGLYLSAKKYGKDFKPSNFKTPKQPKTGQLAFEGMESAVAGSPKKKAIKAAAVGAGLVGLHVAELGADGLAVRAFHRQKRDNKAGPVKKDLTDAVEEITKAYRSRAITREQAIELACNLVEKEEISKWTPPGILRGIKNTVTGTTVFAKPPTARVAAGGRRLSRLSPRVRAKQRAVVAEHTLADLPKARTLALRTTAVGTGALVGTIAYKKGKKKGIAAVYNGQVTKSDDTVDYGFTGEISKVDTDKRLAFGWCSLSEMDGSPVVDLQNDYAPIEEIEKSAYAYVKESRVGGDMHTRDGEVAKHTSDLVESFIATPDKLRQMGLSEEVAKSVPTGWWVGFHVKDDDQWAMVKDGRRAGFSIHGKGSRVSKVLDD